MRRRLTLKQLEANRLNALKSTGPKTAEGKAIVRTNAVKHGIFAKNTVITTCGYYESEKDFNSLLAGLVRDYEPVGTMEKFLVTRIADCIWRLLRVRRAESRTLQGVVSAKSSGPKILEVRAPKPGVERDSYGRPLTDETVVIDRLEIKGPGGDESRGSSLPPKEELDKLTKYETSIERQLYKAAGELARLQRRRMGDDGASGRF